LPLPKKFIRKRLIVANTEELKKESQKTPRQEIKQIEISKNKIPQLINFPATSILPGTFGKGALGIGFIKPRPNIPEIYVSRTSPQGNPIVSEPERYIYFFYEYNNLDISISIGKHLKSFAVILTLSSTTVKNVSEMLGVSADNITPLTKNEYLNNSFNHPTYINDSNTPFQIRYAEIPILKQVTPGRLDNIPLGFPDFDSTPDGIINVQGPIPSAPYTNFTSSTGATSSVTIIPGGTVAFKDTTVNTPWQFAPTGWSWEFGPSASPTGSTQQNPIITYGSTGSYTVILTASNSTGATSKTKTNFVIVTN
jgi:PKD repeat protein